MAINTMGKTDIFSTSDNAYARYIRGAEASGKSYYSHGSQAYDVSRLPAARPRANAVPNEDDDRRAPSPRIKKPEKKIKQPVRKVKKKAAPAVTIHKDVQIKHRSALFSYLLLAVVFIGVMANIQAYAANEGTRIQINQAKENLAELKRSNTALKAEINESFDAKEIERIAKTKLNMDVPQEHQIVYISIPKQSYFVQYDDLADAKQEDFSVAGLFSVFFR